MAARNTAAHLQCLDAMLCVHVTQLAMADAVLSCASATEAMR